MRYLPSTWIPCADCDGQRFSDEVLAAQGAVRRAPASRSPTSSRCPSPRSAGCCAMKPGCRRAAGRPPGASCTRCATSAWATCRSASPRPRSRAARRSASSWRSYLGKRSLAGQLLVLDEPSTGLHPQDLAGLLAVLDRLVRAGATVVVVEHNIDIIRAADWVVDLGPGAGPAGGRLLYAGPPEGLLDVARFADRPGAARRETGRAASRNRAVLPSPQRLRRCRPSRLHLASAAPAPTTCKAWTSTSPKAR